MPSKSLPKYVFLSFPEGSLQETLYKRLFERVPNGLSKRLFQQTGQRTL